MYIVYIYIYIYIYIYNIYMYVYMEDNCNIYDNEVVPIQE